MKRIEKGELIIRDSMQLAFAGRELWCIELDSLNVHSDIVIDKFLKDMIITRKPSSPSLIIIHLTETEVGEELIEIIVKELSYACNSIRKVVFVGLNRRAKKLMKVDLEREKVFFVYNFIDDYEKAKQWLASKTDSI